MKPIKTKHIIALGCLIVLAGCQSAFLDIKPSTQTVVPVTLEDLVLLLSDDNTLRYSGPFTLNMIGAGEYSMSDAHYAALAAGPQSDYLKNAYTWETVVYTGLETSTDWSNGYRRILLANVVLDRLSTMERTAENAHLYDDIKGSALFHRAFNYYMLAQQYCSRYDPDDSGALGLPLRDESDPTLRRDRSSVLGTYSFILNDLLESERLLPDSKLVRTKIEPTKASVYAMLARLYMQMDNYSEAAAYAGKCLEKNSELLDYGEVDGSATVPFPPHGLENDEVIFANYAPVQIIYGPTRMNIHPEILQLYEEGDHRKTVYFRTSAGRIVFKGSYGGTTSFLFTGLATDEVYLNLAECLIRTDRVGEGMNYLNLLRGKRIAPANYVPLATSDVEQALRWVLTERRRQLLMRGTRWEDLRRLNRDERFAEDLRREVAETVYTLPANSTRYTWPIPMDAIVNGGYEQNVR